MVGACGVCLVLVVALAQLLHAAVAQFESVWGLAVAVNRVGGRVNSLAHCLQPQALVDFALPPQVCFDANPELQLFVRCAPDCVQTTDESLERLMSIVCRVERSTVNKTPVTAPHGVSQVTAQHAAGFPSHDNPFCDEGGSVVPSATEVSSNETADPDSYRLPIVFRMPQTEWLSAKNTAASVQIDRLCAITSSSGTRECRVFESARVLPSGAARGISGDDYGQCCESLATDPVILQAQIPSTSFTNEIYRLNCMASDGFFSLSFGGYTTRPLPWNSTEQSLTQGLTTLEKWASVTVFAANPTQLCDSFAPSTTFLSLRFPLIQQLLLTSVFQPEIQAIETFADTNQIIDRALVSISLFVANKVILVPANLTTSDLDRMDFKTRLESLPLIGNVSVSTTATSAKGTSLWMITFHSLSGVIPLIKVTPVDFPAKWTGVGDQIRVRRIQFGSRPDTQISVVLRSDAWPLFGSFRIRVGIRSTEQIPFQARSDTITSAIEALGYAGHVQVMRSDSVNTSGSVIFETRWVIKFVNIGVKIPQLEPLWRHVTSTNSCCLDCVLPSYPYTGSIGEQLEVVRLVDSHPDISGSFRVRVILDNDILGSTDALPIDLSATDLQQRLQSILGFSMPIRLLEVRSTARSAAFGENSWLLVWQIDRTVKSLPAFQVQSLGFAAQVTVVAEHFPRVGPQANQLRIVNSNVTFNAGSSVGVTDLMVFANASAMNTQDLSAYKRGRSFAISQEWCSPEAREPSCLSEASPTLDATATAADVRNALEQLIGVQSRMQVVKFSFVDRVEWHIINARLHQHTHLSVRSTSSFVRLRGFQRMFRVLGTSSQLRDALSRSHIASLHGEENLQLVAAQTVRLSLPAQIQLAPRERFLLRNLSFVFPNPLWRPWALANPVRLRLDGSMGSFVQVLDIATDTRQSMADSSLEVRGSVVEVNASLESFVFQPDDSLTTCPLSQQAFEIRTVLRKDIHQIQTVSSSRAKGQPVGTFSLGVSIARGNYFIDDSIVDVSVDGVACNSLPIAHDAAPSTVETLILQMPCQNVASLQRREIQVVQLEFFDTVAQLSVTGVFSLKLNNQLVTDISPSSSAQVLRQRLLGIVQDNSLEVTRQDVHDGRSILWSITFGSTEQLNRGILDAVTTSNTAFQVITFVVQRAVQSVQLSTLFPALTVRVQKPNSAHEFAMSIALWNRRKHTNDLNDPPEFFVASQSFQDSATQQTLLVAISNDDHLFKDTSSVSITGSFRLRIEGQLTPPIAYTSSGLQLRDAINGSTAISKQFDEIHAVREGSNEQVATWRLEFLGAHQLHPDPIDIEVEEVVLSPFVYDVTVTPVTPMILQSAVLMVKLYTTNDDLTLVDSTTLTWSVTMDSASKQPPFVRIWTPSLPLMVSSSQPTLLGGVFLEENNVLEQELTLTIACSEGTLVQEGQPWTGKSNVTLVGHISTLNEELTKLLAYWPLTNSSGHDVISISVNDTYRSTQGRVPVVVVVVNASTENPLLLLRKDLIQTVPGHPTPVEGVTVRCLTCDAAAVVLVNVRVEAQDCVVSLGGEELRFVRLVRGSGADDHVLEISGSFERLNVALASLSARSFESKDVGTISFQVKWASEETFSDRQMILVVANDAVVSPRLTLKGSATETTGSSSVSLATQENQSLTFDSLTIESDAGYDSDAFLYRLVISATFGQVAPFGRGANATVVLEYDELRETNRLLSLTRYIPKPGFGGYEWLTFDIQVRSRDTSFPVDRILAGTKNKVAVFVAPADNVPTLRWASSATAPSMVISSLAPQRLPVLVIDDNKENTEESIVVVDVTVPFGGVRAQSSDPSFAFWTEPPQKTMNFRGSMRDARQFLNAMWYHPSSDLVPGSSFHATIVVSKEDAQNNEPLRVLHAANTAVIVNVSDAFDQRTGTRIVTETTIVDREEVVDVATMLTVSDLSLNKTDSISISAAVGRLGDSLTSETDSSVTVMDSEEFQRFKSGVRKLYYFPRQTTTDEIQLSVDGRLISRAFVHLRAKRTPPTIVFLQMPPSASVLPAFQVEDHVDLPEEQINPFDVLSVQIRWPSGHVVLDRDSPSLDGVWLEELNEISAFALRGPLQRLNSFFKASPVALIPHLETLLRNTMEPVVICASNDDALQQCEQVMPELDDLGGFVRFASWSESAITSFDGELVDLTPFWVLEFPSQWELQRVRCELASDMEGYFVLPPSTPCFSKLQNASVASNNRKKLSFEGNLSCVQDLLAEMAFQLPPMSTGTIVLGLELFHVDTQSLLLARSLPVRVGARQLSVDVIIDPSNMTSRQLPFVRSTRPQLLPARLSINMTIASSDPEPLLDLNVSVLTGSVARTKDAVYEPGISYGLPGQNSVLRRFRGPVSSLNRILRQVVYATPVTPAVSGDTMTISLQLVGSNPQATSNWSIPITITNPTEPSFRLKTARFLHQLDSIDEVIPLAPVNVVGSLDPNESSILRISCTLPESVLLIQGISHSCKSTVEMPSPLVEVSIWLSEVRYSLESFVANGVEEIHYELEIPATGLRSSTTQQVIIQNTRRNRLALRLQQSEVIELAEDTSLVIADRVVIDSPGSMALTMQLTASIGQLRLPQEVCCVYLRSTTSHLVVMEGTANDLQNAVEMVIYDAATDFVGQDTIVFKVRGEDDETDTVSLSLRVHSVNDAPRIRYNGVTAAVNNGSIVQSVVLMDPDTPSLTLSNAAAPFRLNVSSTSGELQFSYLPHGAKILTSEAGRRDGFTNITLEAPLEELNRMMSRFLYTRTTPIQEQQDRLAIVVNDLGHGGAFVLAEETTRVVQLRDPAMDVQQEAILTVPASGIHLDPWQQMVMMDGVTLQDVDRKYDAVRFGSSRLQLRGFCGWSVDLEIQQVTLRLPVETQVFVVQTSATPGSGRIAGSFDLVFDFPSNQQIIATLQADAVAMRVDELMGNQGTGRGSGESVEAVLRRALPNGFSFHVIKQFPSTAEGGNTWRLVFTTPPFPLPTPQIDATKLIGASAVKASVQEATYSPSGTIDFAHWRLRVGKEETSLLDFDATSQDVQEALQQLAAIEAVDVSVKSTRSNVVETVWTITFLSPTDEIPLVEAVMAAPFTSNKALEAFALDVERISKGKGQGNLYEIVVGATHANQVYALKSQSNSLISGEFTLAFGFVNDLLQLDQVATDMIAVDAVATVPEEGLLHSEGGRVFGSIERHLLNAIRKLPASALAIAIDRNAIQVGVSRSAPDAFGGFTWLITFINAPVAFPALTVADTSRVNGLNAAVTVVPLQAANAVGGHFTLSYNSYTTNAIPFDASASEIKHELETLRSVRDASHDFGGVVVSKSSSSLENGCRFFVLFIEQFAPATNATLSADGSLLTGMGAFAQVQVLRQRNDAEGFFQFLPAEPPNDVFAHSVINGLTMDTVPDAFAILGHSNDFLDSLHTIGYHLAPFWFGYVQFFFQVAVDHEVLSSVATPRVAVPFVTPELLVGSSVALLETNENEPMVLSPLFIQLPHELDLQWMDVLLSVEKGSLTVDGEEHKQMRFGGTQSMVNRQIDQIRFLAGPNTDGYDRLRIAVTLSTSTSVDEAAEFFIQVHCVFKKALIHLNGTVEDPGGSNSWTNARVQVGGNTATSVGIVWIEDPEVTSHNAAFALTLSAHSGKLFFSESSGVNLTPQRSGELLVESPSVALLNRALTFLSYQSADCFVGNDMASLQLTTTVNGMSQSHHRSIDVVVVSPPKVPRVVVNVTSYSSHEGAAFQFPDLRLEFPTSSACMCNSTAKHRAQFQLWRVHLLRPEVDFELPLAKRDDWTHQQVKDFVPNTDNGSPRYFCSFQNLIFFSADDGQHGEELWVTDGTLAGTRMAMELVPGSPGSQPSYLSVVNSKLLFAASGVDLSWKVVETTCNGMRKSSVAPEVLFVVSKSNVWTPSTVLDCPTGYHWASSAEGASFFPQRNASSANAPDREKEPYVYWNTCGWSGFMFGGLSRRYFRFSNSDVTGATKHAGRKDSAPIEVSFSTTEFAGIVCALNDETENNEIAGNRELWQTDGTVSGTTRVKDIYPGPIGSDPRYLTPYSSASMVVFQAKTAAYGVELFKTDGTVGGTVLVEDIWQGPRSSNPRYFTEWSVDLRVYFAATTDFGTELWVSDMFSSFTSERNWKRNVAGGTMMVKDICAGADSSEPRFLTSSTLGLFFSASDCVHGRELWISDGTNAGTQMVKDINVSPGIGADPAFLTVFGTKLYFRAKGSDAFGYELYVSDGTAGGTSQLVDLVPGPLSSSPSLLRVVPLTLRSGVVAATFLFFFARDDHNRLGLWKTDGTVAGTTAVLDELVFSDQSFDLEDDESLAGLSTTRTLLKKNVLLFPMRLRYSSDRSPMVSDSQTQVPYQVNVRVNSGSIRVADSANLNYSQQADGWIRMQGPYWVLQDALNHLTYLPMRYWNSESGDSDNQIVEWSFQVTEPTFGLSSETTTNLVVKATATAPVIITPPLLQQMPVPKGFPFAFDAQCAPILVQEDVLTPLRRFSVFAGDSTHNGVDDPFYQLRVEISVLHGTLELSETYCINELQQQSTVFQDFTEFSIHFSADVDCIGNVVFSSWSYRASSNFNGYDLLRIHVTSPTQLMTQVAVPIIVQPVNDAPYLNSAVYYEGKEDTPLIISDLVAIDPDAAGNTLEVSVVVLHGTISLVHTIGVVFLNGSPSNSSSIRFSGTLTQVNAALSEVVFTAARNWNSLLADEHDQGNGYAVVQVTLRDFNAFNSSTSSQLWIFVAPTPDIVTIAPPTNAAPSVFASNSLDAQGFPVLKGIEDTWIDTTGLAFACADEDEQSSLQVELSVTHGILSLSRALVSFQDATVDLSRHIKIKGTYATVNQAVAHLRYSPSANYNGNDQLVITATAFSEYSLQFSIQNMITVAIVVEAVNDPPVWMVGSQALSPLMPLVLPLDVQSPHTMISNVRFEDVDVLGLDCAANASLCQMELTLEATNGFFTLPLAPNVLGTTVVHSAFFTLTEIHFKLMRVLSEIVFEGDASQDSKILLLTIDDQGNIGDGGPNAVENRILFDDLNRRLIGALQVNGLDKVVEIDEDTALDIAQLAVKVEDLDTLSKATRLYRCVLHASHGVFALHSSIGIRMVSNDSNSSWTTMVFESTLMNANNALKKATYLPHVNWYGTESISIEVSDLSLPTRRDKRESLVTVLPVCDEPEWRDVPDSPMVIMEDTAVVINGIHLLDVEEEQRQVQVRITAAHGGVILATSSGLQISGQVFSSVGAAYKNEESPSTSENKAIASQLFLSSVQLRGTTKDVNAALNGVIYRPNEHYNTFKRQDETITLSVSGCGLNLSATATIHIQIHAVNDAPHIRSLGTEQEVLEDTLLQINPLVIEDFDTQDADGDALGVLVTFICDHGFIHFDETQEPDQTAKASSVMISHSDSGMTLWASLQRINAVLTMPGLVFRGDGDFFGVATVVVNVTDLGNYGAGGELVDSLTLHITVRAVNDPPVIRLPLSLEQIPMFSVDEGSSLVLSGAKPVPLVIVPPSAPAKSWSLMSSQPLVERWKPTDHATRFQTLHEYAIGDDDGVAFLTVLRGKLLFRGEDKQRGRELWQSDGTSSGTLLLKDLFPGPQHGNPSYLKRFSVDDRVYFAADGLDLSWMLVEPWRDKCGGRRTSSFSSSIEFVVSQSALWDPDQAYDCPLGMHWMTTEEATALFQGAAPSGGHPSEPLVYFGQCGWTGYDWGSTTRKHFRFADSKITGALKHAGYRDSYRPDVDFSTSFFAGIVCMRDSSSSIASVRGSELWVTDGTPPGTYRIVDINPGPPNSSPSFLVEYKSLLYFQATTANYGAELWRTDGTRANTVQVADIEPGVDGSTPEFLTVSNHLLFFSAFRQESGRELWFSDGQLRTYPLTSHSAVGIGLVADICPGQRSSNPVHLVTLSTTNLLLFQADDCVHGAELWRSDGTSGGTSLVADIYVGPDGSSPSFLVEFTNKIFFQADDGIHGAELWVSDGTGPGTRMLVDLTTGMLGSKPSFLTVAPQIAGSLVFTASTPSLELWRTDGTAAGTVRAFPFSLETFDLNSISHTDQAFPAAITAMDSAVFFFGRYPAAPMPLPISRREENPRVQSRSFTLEDAESMMMPNAPLVVVLNCSKGLLRIGADENQSLTLRGPLADLNRALQQVEYSPIPSQSGRDEIQVSLSDAPTQPDEDGTAYTVTGRVEINIQALNNAPVVQMPSSFDIAIDQTTRLHGIVVSDADAGDGLVFVQVSTHLGRIQMDQELFGQLGDTLLVQEDSKWGFASTIANANELLGTLSYTCECQRGARDYLHVEVDDNGHTGVGGAKTGSFTSVLQLQE